MTKIEKGYSFGRSGHRVEVLELFMGRAFTVVTLRGDFQRHNIEIMTTDPAGVGSLQELPGRCRKHNRLGIEIPVSPEEAQLEWEAFKTELKAAIEKEQAIESLKKEREEQLQLARNEKKAKGRMFINTRTEAKNELQSLITATSLDNIADLARIKELAGILVFYDTLISNLK